MNDDKAMAAAWQKMVEMDKNEFSRLGKAARQRCLDNFTLEQQVHQHEDLYKALHQQNIQSNPNLNQAQVSS